MTWSHTSEEVGRVWIEPPNHRVLVGGIVNTIEATGGSSVYFGDSEVKPSNNCRRMSCFGSSVRYRFARCAAGRAGLSLTEQDSGLEADA